MIRLSVPGTLHYRDLVLRVIASSCKLVRAQVLQDGGQGEEFDAQVVSAIGEAFNNVAIHGYAGRVPEIVSFEIEPNGDGIVIRMMDTGKSFEWAHREPPELATLPESGMGLFIIRSFVDSAVYEPGHPPATPNVLSITKCYTVAD
jgi:serine/threonine-protein kinase RsbW